MSEEELKEYLEERNMSEQLFRNTALGILNKFTTVGLFNIFIKFTRDNPELMEELQKEKEMKNE